jgi:hypothetical protein
MADGDDPTPQTRGDEDGIQEQVEGQGGEGQRAAGVTPPIADDAEAGQTASPAPPDDVGVPPDEELAQEEESQG